MLTEGQVREVSKYLEDKYKNMTVWDGDSTDFEILTQAQELIDWILGTGDPPYFIKEKDFKWYKNNGPTIGVSLWSG
jgi:trans-aconitate methyltransferase